MSDVKISITYGATLNTTQRGKDVKVPAEFERLDALAAELLKVPKAELDEQRANS